MAKLTIDWGKKQKADPRYEQFNITKELKNLRDVKASEESQKRKKKN